MKVTLLGVRGTVPVSGGAFLRFGGDTTSVLVETADACLLLDGGTGLRAVPSGIHAALLLTHPHTDHLLGLPAWPALFDARTQLTVYGAVRGGLTVPEQLRCLIAPPLWPVTPADFLAAVSYETLPARSFSLGPFTIESAEGNHPGGVTVYRISESGRSLVFCTDCELDEATRARLLPFAAGCDLLLADGEYSDASYDLHRGWGHSCDTMAAEFGRCCGARRTVLIHHDPYSNDDTLSARSRALEAVYPGCAMGAQGEEFLL